MTSPIVVSGCSMAPGTGDRNRWDESESNLSDGFWVELRAIW